MITETRKAIFNNIDDLSEIMNISKNEKDAYKKFSQLLLWENIKNLILKLIKDKNINFNIWTRDLWVKMELILSDNEAPINKELKLSKEEKIWIILICELYKIELNRQWKLNTILLVINNDITITPYLIYMNNIINKINFNY